MKDYKNLLEVEVHSQEEMNEIPLDYQGRICIKDTVEKIIVNNEYRYFVVVYGNSSVDAYGNSSIEVKGNSNVNAYGNSMVVARGNSMVVARGNSRVVAYGNSMVEAWESSSVEAYGNLSVVAWESSSVGAWKNSRVVARGSSRVVARGSSRVEAWENSRVEAWEKSRVEAYGNVQVLDRISNGKIQISGNARIVYLPKNIEKFMNYYNIKHTKTKAIFFKAVHKKENLYLSDYDSKFEYNIGKILKNECDNNFERVCSYGIHISSLQFALDFGKNWKDLAILECETKISDIVLPKNSDGKVRTSQIKVLREVPLSECGLYGKILEKRLEK